MIEAIDHAITAGDVHYAADELERRWLEFYSSGHATALLSFIDRLPEEAIVAHPVLALARAGVARSLGQMDEVELWLQRAEQAGPDAPAPGWATTIAAGAALSRSLYRLALGDVPGAIAAARRGVELETDTDTPEYAIARYFLAMPLFYDDPASAGPLLRDFLSAIPDGEQDVRRCYAMALLAEVNALDGDVDSADELAGEALQVARRQASRSIRRPSRCTWRWDSRCWPGASSTPPRSASSAPSAWRGAAATGSNTPTRWCGWPGCACSRTTLRVPPTRSAPRARSYPTSAPPRWGAGPGAGARTGWRRARRGRRDRRWRGAD